MDINPDTYHLKLEGDVLLIKGTNYTGIFKLPSDTKFVPFLEILNPNIMSHAEAT